MTTLSDAICYVLRDCGSRQSLIRMHIKIIELGSRSSLYQACPQWHTP